MLTIKNFLNFQMSTGSSGGLPKGEGAVIPRCVGRASSLKAFLLSVLPTVFEVVSDLGWVGPAKVAELASAGLEGAQSQGMPGWAAAVMVMTALLTVLVGVVVVVVVRARREAAGIAQEPVELQIEEVDTSSGGSTDDGAGGDEERPLDAGRTPHPLRLARRWSLLTTPQRQKIVIASRRRLRFALDPPKDGDDTSLE